MDHSRPKILAIGYYDGVTEGFVDGLGDENVYYFKVIAWDDDQDERLFLAGRIDPALYTEFLGVVREASQGSRGPIWIPAWQFMTDEVKVRADALLVEAQHSLKTPSALILSRDLTRDYRLLKSSEKQLSDASALSLRNAPVDLRSWLKGE